MISNGRAQYRSLPTSCFLSEAAEPFREGLNDLEAPSSAYKSAVLRRLSSCEELEEVFRRLRPGGAYRSRERRLFPCPWPLDRGSGLLEREGGVRRSRRLRFPILRLRCFGRGDGA